MAIYGNWKDAEQEYDAESVGTPDIARLQSLWETAEQRLHNRLRSHMAVPIDSGDTEAFGTATKICGKWTAAEYLRWRASAEGTKDNTWYADHLDQQAEELLQQMVSRLQAPDAGVPTDPISYVPYAGAAADYPTAIFTRDHLKASPGGPW